MKRITITKDRVNNVIDELSKLIGKQVLVGIPEATTTRDMDDGPISNAALGYIHEFGAPGANIPARPFLVPGVRKAQKKALVHLRAACDAAIKGREDQSDKQLAAAGMVAAVGAQVEIHTANFVPLKPGSVRSRKYSRNTKSRRQSETQYLAMVKAGVPAAEAQTAAGIHPLINTGQLARSITSVVRSIAGKKAPHRPRTGVKGEAMNAVADVAEMAGKAVGRAAGVVAKDAAEIVEAL